MLVAKCTASFMIYDNGLFTTFMHVTSHTHITHPVVHITR